MRKVSSILFSTLFVLILLSIFAMFSNPATTKAALVADDLPAPEAVTSGIYRGVSTAVQFDASPPLSSLVANAPNLNTPITEIPEWDSGLEGPLGPQDSDPLVQGSVGSGLIPAPLVSFDGPPNVAGVSPPDPVGDVGPNHYVAMSNLYSAIYDKTGTLLLGPFPNNTLWAGFGGDCEFENAGDPIVVYDQLADRWILTQFTSSVAAPFYNCVAISQTPDPTGAYYRYAFTTGSNFPDYPKYGIWPDAYYISTREFAGSFVGIGVYAINRAQMLAGNPTPQVVSFFVPPGGTPYNVGDGLLPTDIDGFTLPPAGAPNYFVGSMDDGGQYGAPQDALNIWEFHVDFNTPSNSTFTLEHVIPVGAFDSQFPCSPGSRSCIPQPTTTNKVDILSYRQRPMWRLAYRNFGTHEALVTNQSVEAAPNLAGIRWYEIRDPDNSPFIFQQGTYAPGVTDGIHRWMGSIAMDHSGNMGLGYSASDGTGTFPSVWYTGRLESDPLGTMPQGEASIINGTGAQLTSQRWGDYTSMNIDPVDDCTFWYINEYLPVSSGNGWQLRVGAFRFNECQSYDFYLTANPPAQEVCAPNDAVYTVNVGSHQGYTDTVTLSANGNPAGTTANFSVNGLAAPYTSTLTIDTSGAAAFGNYDIDIVGMGPTSTHTTTVQLNLCGSTIEVEPESLSSSQYPNVQVGQSLTISNTGLADLTWDIFEDGTPGFGGSWSDNFDSYATGSQMHGQGGWKGWDNSPAAGALTSDLFALSAPNSVDILNVSDLVHEYSGYTSGQWIYTAHQYIPSNYSGDQMFILLNTYNDGGPNNWSTQVRFQSATNQVLSDFDGATLPLITGQWVELRIEIDLDADVQTFYYDGQMLYQKSWTEGVSGGGVANIAAVDLWSNGGTSIYYDNFSLTPPITTCDGPDDMAWVTVNPISGTVPSLSADTVDVTFDSTGYAAGVYSGTLCINSNDVTNPLVSVPLTMTVLPNVVPVAVNDAYTTTQDTAVSIAAPGVLDNDSDGNGDPLTAVLDTAPSNGTLDFSSDGSFTYTPTLGFDGSDSFTYHADDGLDASEVATVTITVLNTAPVAVADTYSTTEDVTLTVAAPGILANDSDADGDGLTAVLDSDVMSGTLSLNADGSFVYTPTAGFAGQDTFTYHVNDGTDDSNVVQVTITVEAVIEPPPGNSIFLPFVARD